MPAAVRSHDFDVVWHRGPPPAVDISTLRAWLRRRLGGYTGDTLGASEQLAEAALLLALAA